MFCTYRLEAPSGFEPLNKGLQNQFVPWVFIWLQVLCPFCTRSASVYPHSIVGRFLPDVAVTHHALQGRVAEEFHQNGRAHTRFAEACRKCMAQLVEREEQAELLARLIVGTIYFLHRTLRILRTREEPWRVQFRRPLHSRFNNHLRLRC